MIRQHGCMKEMLHKLRSGKVSLVYNNNMNLSCVCVQEL